MTNDCDFPLKIEGQLLTQLWKCMLNESLREMGYMADLAGTSLSLTVNNEYLKLNYFAYNDNIEAYLADVFGSL
jgi:secreted Zn-dependent insulinase-like peptidase